MHRNAEGQWQHYLKHSNELYNLHVCNVFPRSFSQIIWTVSHVILRKSRLCQNTEAWFHLAQFNPQCQQCFRKCIPSWYQDRTDIIIILLCEFQFGHSSKLDILMLFYSVKATIAIQSLATKNYAYDVVWCHGNVILNLNFHRRCMLAKPFISCAVVEASNFMRRWLKYSRKMAES